MIYVVSGYLRTGTSMMMQALTAGGLEPAFDPARDETLDARFSDDRYRGNAGGYYEIPLGEYRQPGFPLAYEGKLIKVFFWGLPNLAVHRYLVIFMRRDPEEIRQSYEAFLGKPADPFIIGNYDALMDHAIALLVNRRDTRVAEVPYRDVIEHPKETFRTLWEAGWPIHVEAAAATVKPDLYRFRRERLTEGI